MDADTIEQTDQHVHFFKEKYVPRWCCEAKNPILCSSSLAVGGVAVNLMLAYPPQSPLSTSAIYPLPPFLRKSALCISQSGHRSRSHNTSKLEPPMLPLSSRSLPSPT